MRQNYNKKNKGLALLGQGKWKHALRSALVLMGFMMGFGMMGAYAQLPTNGLYMHKDWVPNYDDCPNGDCGYIRLETFVTGDKILIQKDIPSDIVLVLDVSSSMRATRGTQARITNAADRALTYNKVAGARTAEANYTYNGYQVFAEEYNNGSENRYCLYYNSSGSDDRNYFRSNGNTSTNRNDAAYSTSPDGVIYTFANNSQLRRGSSRIFELKKAVADFVETINQMDLKEDGTRIGNKLSIITYCRYTTMHQELAAMGDINIDELKQKVWGFTLAQGTAPSLGIDDANTEFANNPHTGETIGEDFTRTVVLFTDGEPYETSPNTTYRAVGRAQISKQTYGATVYSIGMFTTSPAQNSTTWRFLNYISSNYPNAYLNGDGSQAGHMQPGTGGNPTAGFYIDASNDEMDLSDIFQSIAETAGGSSFDLGSETVVQDVISPNFQLDIPSGQTAGTTIKAYAPKCNGKTGDVFTFEPETDGATRLTFDADGVVNGGDENRLADGIVNFDPDTKTLTFTDFNFSAMYVAQEMNDNGTPYIDPETHRPVFFGRKLVMLIPLRVEEGTWGDDMATNGPLSIIEPDGDTLNPLYFNIPTANVIGTVWTEVITSEPPGFNAMDIDTPEELAWFISVVNGRANYKDNSDVVSTPSASARLTADIDMSAHNWVSIGEGTDGYTGTFDGNGHVITGLKNNATKYYKLNDRAMVYPGMFSNVKGTVKNVFVLDADFRAKNHLLDEEDEFKTFIHFGIIADTLSSSGTIYNCEAVGRITSNDDTKTVLHYTNEEGDEVEETQLERDAQMIFGGLVGYNDGGTIHSTMSMAELTGYTLGGAVGLNNGPFSNSFTNGVYNYLDNDIEGKYVGGIVAQNTGTINNCYVRFERDNQNLDKTNFGMLVGTGTAPTNSYTPQIVTWSRPDHLSVTEETITNRTIPNTITDPQDNPATSYTLTVSPTFYNMFTNDNSIGGTWGTVTNSSGTYNVYAGGTPLLDKLNDYVDNYDGDEQLSSWKRTTAGVYSDGAGDINDDYPVLVFPEYTCLGSADGIRIDYAASLNEMLHRHNNGNLNENTILEGDKYKPTNHTAIYKGTINLYANDDVTIETTGSKAGEEEVADDCTAAGVVVYIDENISLLQGEDSEIEAYTGQSLQAFNNTGIQAGNRWHNISSSLSNSMFGWYYNTTTEVEHNLSDNPCGWTTNISDEDEAFFPIDLSSRHRADFYCFFEPEYHWINFKRNGVSHWHMDLINDAVSYDEPTNHAKINYYYNYKDEDEEEFSEVHDNETQFIPGKGYLAAVDMSTYWTAYGKKAQFMQNRGTLNNGEIEIPVTYTAANEWTGLAGYNLLGNPYQSYLDFTTFAWENSSLWNNPSEMTFAIYDPETNNYLPGLAGAQPSEGSMATTGDINMHQGFFIRVSQAGENTKATFNNSMRFNTPANGTHFRGERLNYPVINLIATDSEGNTDVSVLEVGRPENGGGEKLRVGSATGRISLRHDDTDFGILFRDMTEGSQPLRFETQEDGTFTLSWNTANANFSSLTLVDNITGVNYDMLTHDSYEFEGRASDYKSRFKILIGEFTDVEENEETVTNNFAFFDGSEWVVNGKGQLTVTDVMGRMVYTDNLTNDQNHVSLNGLSQGVYLLQVRNGNGAMVQKIVVR